MYPYYYQPPQPPFEETHYYYDPYEAERQQQQAQQSQQQQSYQQLLNVLMSSIIGEATAVDFYTRLAKEAPNEYSRKVLLDAAKDEKTHLQLFTRLYTSITGKQPNYKIRPVKIQNFRQGLFEAYEDELADYEKYRNAYLMTQDPTIRDTFFRPFSDEIKHATKFSFLLNSR
ncbi:ferritin-like domain-containing protein [Fictibacillus fluitans]|uniref:Ferritin-like domain-containing protein n=1 Tax=Fictibacillus fluitans TaxID=3058422 RepID=A0ABT8HWT4_9BACL|nr:ferritin-like domain-containing protein [Fictibacillus sp. NE201]MDN4525219.1 ferritin-like domain-containing protein [Fictibacillus sp. NE201]